MYITLHCTLTTYCGQWAAAAGNLHFRLHFIFFCCSALQMRERERERERKGERERERERERGEERGRG